MFWKKRVLLKDRDPPVHFLCCYIFVLPSSHLSSAVFSLYKIVVFYLFICYEISAVILHFFGFYDSKYCRVEKKYLNAIK